MSEHRVLIIGVGSIGERHLRCFQLTGRASLSFCETDQTLRAAIADRYDVQTHYGTLDEALKKGAGLYDVAVVATPAHLHIPMAKQLVNAGVHTFIEKPLSLTTDGIDELDELAREQGVVACVAYTYRSHPALQDMKEAIDQNRFGRPVQVVSVWGQHFPKYRPAYREIYYKSRETGGGIIQDLLPHAINGVEWIVGPVDRVMADAAHLILEGVEVEDTVHVIARHGDVLAVYSSNQHQPPNELTTTIICERGIAKFNLHDGCWYSMTEPGGAWELAYDFKGERDDVFINQANIFLDVVEGRAEPRCTLAEGKQSVRVTLAVLASAAHPAWRPVDS
jgi:predicted dehydrogenase